MASRIIKRGFRIGETFFASSSELADVFAWEAGAALSAGTQFPNLTRILITLPDDVCEVLSQCACERPVGSDGARPVDIGDGMEIVLSAAGVRMLNRYIRNGRVSLRRRIIHNPRRGVFHGGVQA